jgi:YVTN family beta-propeller protein
MLPDVVQEAEEGQPVGRSILAIAHYGGIRLRNTERSYAVRSAFLFLLVLGASVATLSCRTQNVPVVTSTDGPTLARPGDTVVFRATAVDRKELPLTYQFAWGDSTSIESTAAYSSGTEVSRRHVYSDSGQFSVRVRARNDLDVASEWSQPHAIRIALLAPSVPIVPEGPAACTVLTSPAFSTYSTSPYGDVVTYLFDWGDGQYSDWTGPYSSAETCRLSHQYLIGDTTVEIRCRAMDRSGMESDWSSPKQLRVEPVGYPYRITGTFPVPTGYLRGMAFLPSTRTIYAVCDYYRYHCIYALDTQNGSVRTAVDSIGGLTGICALRNSPFIYVTSWVNYSVMAIRASDDSIVATARLGSSRMTDVAPAVDDSRIYAASCSFGGCIGVLRTSDNTMEDTINLGTLPTHLAVSPDGQYLYISTQSDDVMVMRLLDNVITASIPVGHVPEGLTVSPNGQYVYVANNGDGTISVIRTEDNVVVSTIPASSNVQQLAILPNGAYLYTSGVDFATVRLADFAEVPLSARFSFALCPIATPDGSIYLSGELVGGQEGVFKLGY